ncbi:MAG: diguanylate cyclase [Synergistaceae bacterium]|nr:diguanylate cyclase [Synergistaceae bacterium]
MDWFALYPYFLYAVIAVYLALFLYSLKFSKGPLSSIFGLICLANAAYVAGAAMQFNSVTAEEVFFAQRIRYYGVESLLVLNFVFAYKVRYRKRLSPMTGLLISLIPILIMVLVNTNDFHGLFYADVKFFEYGGHLFSKRAPGPLYFISYTYVYFVTAFGIYAFFSGWRKSGFRLKSPYPLLLAGRVLPMLFNIIYQKGLSPFWMDLMPVTLLLSALFYLAAIRKYKILEIGEIYGREIFSNIKEGMLLLSPSGALLEYNDSAAAVFPWLTEKNIKRPVLELDSRFNVEQGAREFRISQGTGDEERIYEFRLTELAEEGELLGYLYVFIDVTDNIRLIEKLKYMADHDSLTKLYNRGRILRELEGLIAGRRYENYPFSLLMIDIDHFKNINDELGHLAGNEVLKRVAAVCVEVVAPEGMVGRYGGEEFLILLPGVSGGKAAEKAEQLRARIEGLTLFFNGRSISATISAGVMDGAVGRDNLRIDYLVSRADEAMYRAKNDGRNRVAVYGSPDAVAG